MDGKKESRMDGQTQRNKQVDGRDMGTVGQTDRKMNAWRNIGTVGWTDEWIDRCNEQMDE